MVAPVPTPPVRGYSFTTHETLQPDTPLPGTKVDEEIDALCDVVGETIAFTRQAIDDEGKIKEDALPDAIRPEFTPDATGPLVELTDYDAEAKGFAFLDTDNSEIYFKASDTSGDWADPVPFATGPAGPTGPQGVAGPEGPQGPEGPEGPAGAAATSWDDLEDIPSTFPPSSHSHSFADITGFAAAADKGVAYDGSAALIQYAVTSFGRQVAGLANAAALQALLTIPTSPETDIQTFAASGTWNKPTGFSGDAQVRIRAWAAGGGGVSAGGTFRGGGGGGFKEVWKKLSDLGATETVTVPAGGAIATAGGNATFGAHATAYGGGRAGTGAGEHSAGGGGGSLGVGGNGGGSAGTGGLGVVDGYDVGGSNGSSSVFGGGGGKVSGVGGNSVWGGAGGAGVGGTSLYGGNGGGTGVAGSARGGGGGPNAAGGRGEIEVTVFGV